MNINELYELFDKSLNRNQYHIVAGLFFESSDILKNLEPESYYSKFKEWVHKQGYRLVDGSDEEYTR